MLYVLGPIFYKRLQLVLGNNYDILEMDIGSSGFES